MATLTEHYPPLPADIPTVPSSRDLELIAHNQPLYKDVGRTMLRVNGLLQEQGREPGYRLPIGQEELGLLVSKGAASWEFVVGDFEESLPSVTRTKFMDSPSAAEPAHRIFFAESSTEQDNVAVWQARYSHDRGENRALVSRVRPLSRLWLPRLVSFLNHAAVQLEANKPE